MEAVSGVQSDTCASRSLCAGNAAEAQYRRGGLRQSARCLSPTSMRVENPGSSMLSPIKINSYPTAKSLPLHAGIKHGFFERRGVKISLHYEENSHDQRQG